MKKNKFSSNGYFCTLNIHFLKVNPLFFNLNMSFLIVNTFFLGCKTNTNFLSVYCETSVREASIV